MDIRTENLNKSYFLNHGAEIKVLRDINLEVGSGETVAIVGPSGAGKSTLLHILGLMDRQTSGKVILDGADLTMSSDREHAEIRRRKIGFLFQLHYLLPDFTVWENVMLPVWDDKETKLGAVGELLERLGLKDRLHHMPSELSGGEQQRVALARALISVPRLLMADEPTGNLDRETGEMVEEIMLGECRSRGITLLLVTHNPELARKAGRTLTMQDGKLVSQNVAHI